MIDPDEFSVKPFFKADSGSFGGDLKMPISLQPGHRPGDFCLDDVAGSVKVRRGDQSILILGGPAGVPPWAQTVAVGSSSGGPIVVNGSITFPLSSQLITSSGDLTFAPFTGVVNFSTASVLDFAGSGTVVSEGGDLTLAPSSGTVTAISATLNFTQSATLGSTGALTLSSTGALELIPSNGQVNVLSSVLSFNQPATVDVAGTLSFTPQSGIIAFPNDINMTLPPTRYFIVSTSGTNTGTFLQRSDSLGGFLSLNGYHLVSSWTGPPTVTKSDPFATYTIDMLDGSTDTAGGFTLSTDLTQPFDFFVNFYRPYTEATRVFVVFYPINKSAGTFSNGETCYIVNPVIPNVNSFEVVGIIDTLGMGPITLIYAYVVVGVL